MIDYMCMLCHIQLAQIDCTPHYTGALRKIDKYGQRPERFPLVFFVLSHPGWQGKTETDHAMTMCSHC